MGAEKLRKEVLELVKYADVKLLRLFDALGKAYAADADLEVPVNPVYEGMTAEDIKAKLKESRKQSEKGEVHTSEEVRDMIKARK